MLISANFTLSYCGLWWTFSFQGFYFSAPWDHFQSHKWALQAGCYGASFLLRPGCCWPGDCTLLVPASIWDSLLARHTSLSLPSTRAMLLTLNMKHSITITGGIQQSIYNTYNEWVQMYINTFIELEKDGSIFFNNIGTYRSHDHILIHKTRSQNKNVGNCWFNL